MSDDVAFGTCEDCGDLRWCCKASKDRVREVIADMREQAIADETLGGYPNVVAADKLRTWAGRIEQAIGEVLPADTIPTASEGEGQ